MKKLASDELRDQVWKALVAADGDRLKAAEALGKSERTLNRYIRDLNMYPDMDKAGFIRNQGPPRGEAWGKSLREPVVLQHIGRNGGEIDYSELAVEMYRVANEKTLQRVYTTLHELKSKGVIGCAGSHWFVIKPTT